MGAPLARAAAKALSRALAGPGIGVSVPPAIANQTVTFGRYTLANAGGVLVRGTGGYTVTSISITGGADSALFGVKNTKYLVRNSGSGGAAMSLGNKTVQLLVNGVDTITVTVDVVDNAYSACNNQSTNGATAWAEAIAAYRDASMTYGWRILLREGDYNYDCSAATVAFSRTTAPAGTLLTAGTFQTVTHIDEPRTVNVAWITIEPHTDNVAAAKVWHVQFANGGLQDLGLQFKGIVVAARQNSSFQGGASYIFNNTGNARYLSWKDCTYETTCPTRSRYWLPGLITSRLVDASFHYVENCQLDALNNGFWLGGETVIQNSTIVNAVADFFDIVGPYNNTYVGFNRFVGMRDAYSEIAVTNVLRSGEGGCPAGKTRIYGSGLASITTSSWVIFALFDSGTGVAGLDAEWRNTTSGGAAWARDGGNTYLEIDLDSSGFAAYVSGGAIWWGGSHNDGLQGSNADGGASGTLGENDDLTVSCNFFDMVPGPNGDKYDAMNANSPLYLNSGLPQLRRGRIRGNVIRQRTQNQTFLPHSFYGAAMIDCDVSFNMFIRPPGPALKPEYTPVLVGDGGGTSTAKYNFYYTYAGGSASWTGFDEGTPDTNVTLLGQTLTDIFVDPVDMYASVDQVIVGYQHKPGTGLGLAAVTGNAYDAGPMSYVDWTNKTVSWPDETAPAARGQSFVGGFDGSYIGGFNG